MQTVLDLTAILLLCLLQALVYIPSLWGGFVFDDILVTERTAFYRRRKTGIGWQGLFQLLKTGSKRALLYMTFRRDGAIHDHNMLGWHMTNISIAMVCTTAVYALLRYPFDMGPAFMGALAFAFYPPAASAIAYISGRSSSMCTMFLLLGVLAFTCGWYLLVPFCFWLGLQSKEEIVVMPVVLFLWWVFVL